MSQCTPSATIIKKRNSKTKRQSGGVGAHMALPCDHIGWNQVCGFPGNEGESSGYLNN
jgi:hypothetical protein